jgi:phosphoketolase
MSVVTHNATTHDRDMAREFLTALDTNATRFTFPSDARSMARVADHCLSVNDGGLQ